MNVIFEGSKHAAPVPGQKEKMDFSWLEGIKTNESVFFEGKDTYSNFYTRIKAEAKKRGVNVTARTIDGGLRVWRIS